jgi:hypothetical protein
MEIRCELNHKLNHFILKFDKKMFELKKQQ